MTNQVALKVLKDKTYVLSRAYMWHIVRKHLSSTAGRDEWDLFLCFYYNFMLPLCCCQAAGMLQQGRVIAACGQHDDCDATSAQAGQFPPGLLSNTITRANVIDCVAVLYCGGGERAAL